MNLYGFQLHSKPQNILSYDHGLYKQGLEKIIMNFMIRDLMFVEFSLTAGFWRDAVVTKSD